MLLLLVPGFVALGNKSMNARKGALASPGHNKYVRLTRKRAGNR